MNAPVARLVSIQVGLPTVHGEAGAVDQQIELCSERLRLAGASAPG